MSNSNISNTSNLTSFTSIVISQASTSGVVNDFYLTSTILDRLLYVKEAAISPAETKFNLWGRINELSSVTLSNTAAMTLHLSTGIWHILGGLKPNATGFLPVASGLGANVHADMRHTRYFVDVQSGTKTVVLPPIQTIPGIRENISPVYTFKDVFGKAGTAPSAFYISTSGNAALENSSSPNIGIRLTSNYASIDLIANLSTNRWHILNYYGGDATTEASFGNTETPSTIFLSTSLTYMARYSEAGAEINKIAMLPVAENVIGQSFYIANIGDILSTGFSLISTQQGDLMDDSLSSIYLSTQWQAVQLVAHSSTRYSITGNWKDGAAPFV